MRLKSTGLGRTELEGEIVKVKKVDGLVIFHVIRTLICLKKNPKEPDDIMDKSI